MKKILTNYFKAGFPCIAIQTTEETRVFNDILAAAKDANKLKTITWSATEGMREVGGKAIDNTEDLSAACRYEAEKAAKIVFILRDPHTWGFDRDPVLLRALRDFITAAPLTGSVVVIIAHEFRPHPTIEKLCVVLDYNLPAPEDLRAISDGIVESATNSRKEKKLPPKPITPADEGIIRALSGLTTTEAENALSLSIIESGGFDSKIIYREKIKSVKKSGLLEIIEADPRGLDSIGGLNALKGWIVQRRGIWAPEAVKYGLPAPKGVLIVGVPGTGKSLCSKAIGTALEVPTLKLDIGAMFNSLVGETEARIRQALELADALAPCVLWLDEIDKALAGSNSGGGDSGVTKRLFGTILEWMQNKKKPVFVVATANDVTSLGPELLRKGRFDEIFAVDLPDEDDRKAIFSIHLKNRGRDPGLFDLDSVMLPTAQFTGSEIENVLDVAMIGAYSQGREVVSTDLVWAAQQTVPLAVTAKEKIETMRTWAKTRARFASVKEAPQQTARMIG